MAPTDPIETKVAHNHMKYISRENTLRSNDFLINLNFESHFW